MRTAAPFIVCGGVCVYAGNALVIGTGDRETGRQGDRETGGQGDRETGEQGEPETGRQGDRRTGDMGTGDKENRETYFAFRFG